MPRGSAFSGRERGWAVDTPVLVASVALNLLTLATPLAILMIFDRVIPFQSMETLSLLSTALLVVLVLEFGLKWARSTVLTHAAEKAAIGNNATFLSRVLNANPITFSKTSPAVHLERHAAIARLREHYSGQNQALAIDLPFGFLLVAMIGLIGGWLLVVPLATLAIIAVVAVAIKSAQSRIFATRKSLDARRYAFLAEVLGNMATVKSNTMERQMTRRFELLQDQTVDNSQRLILSSGFSQSMGVIISQMSVAGVAIVGAYLVVINMIGIAELAACMLLNGRAIQPSLKLLTFWVQSEGLAQSHAKLAELPGDGIQPRPPRVGEIFRGRVELCGLVLRHPRDETRMTRPLTTTIAPGSVLRIDPQENWMVQALYDVLGGHSDPVAGRALLDGYLAKDSLSRRGAGGVAFLEQRPAIFSGTLIDNISAFGPADQARRAKQIAQALRLEKRVNRLPLGYNTPLGSGGVFEKDPANRQLISLVRALSLTPKVLFLNEPTAMLERPERDALCAYLATLENRPTIVVASPDPRFARLADATLPVSGQSDIVEDWLADAEKERLPNVLRGAA